MSRGTKSRTACVSISERSYLLTFATFFFVAIAEHPTARPVPAQVASLEQNAAIVNIRESTRERLCQQRSRFRCARPLTHDGLHFVAHLHVNARVPLPRNVIPTYGAKPEMPR